MATDFAGMVPTEVVGELIAALEEQSVTMRLGRVVPMGTGAAAVPVSATAPSARFTSTSYGGRKNPTAIDWSHEHLVAEELACVLAIPDAFIDDAGIPIWEMVRGELASAIAVELDGAVLFGTRAPASYPAGGVAAAAAPLVSDADPAKALDLAMATVEATGLEPTGIAGAASIRSALRQISASQMVPSSQPASYTYFGLPVETTPVWDATKGDAFVGDWTKLIVGVRQDVTFDLSSDGVLLDNAGAILVSAFQDDMTLMRCYVRIGVVLGVPVKADNTGATKPFSAAKWAGVAPAGTRASK